MTQYKTCTKCGQTKSILEFGTHKGKKSAKSGIRPACKQCENEYARQRYSLNKNQKNKSAIQWRADNPIAWQIIQKRSYAKNRDQRLLEMQKWREENPLALRNYSNTRRTRKLNAKTFFITPAEIAKMLALVCSYCKTAPSSQLDHIVPLSRGGDHSIGNLTGACKSCNLSKGAKFITEWKRGKIGH